MSTAVAFKSPVPRAAFVVPKPANPNKRRRISELDGLQDVIGGGRILSPSETRRPRAVVRAAATGNKNLSRGPVKGQRANEGQGSIACTCCTLAYLTQDMQSCPAQQHIIKQATSRGFGPGSKLSMVYESGNSIAQSLRPFFDASFGQLRTIIIRRDVLQPINMSLGLVQCGVNNHTGDHSFDVRATYNKRGCVIQAALGLLREAQALSLGFQFFSIDEDSTSEVMFQGGRCIRRTIEVRISKNRGRSAKTAKDREEVYQEVLGITFDAREQEIQGSDELYAWLRSKGADLIA